MLRYFASLAAALIVVSAADAADVAAIVRTIKAVGPEGAGNPEAGRAWRELSRLPAADLPQLLAALDGASPAAANWLRSAVDAVAERERAAGRPLPAAALEAFLRDRRHSGRGRRLAYELLCTADPSAPARLLPTMLDDPGAELRYDAVETAFAAVKPQPIDSAAAKAELRRLLSAARDGGQVEAIARELDRRGETVDLVAHFGFITRWQVAGPFDNADGRGFRTPYPPERGVALAATYAGKGGAVVAWRPAAADKSGIIDLNRLFPGTSPSGRAKGLKAAVAYAYAEVESPVERAVQVRAASATAIRVFVNGHEVLAREMYHQSFDRDMHTAPARLASGRNAVLVKVCQNDQPEDWAQNWMFQLRMTDDLGAAAPVTVVTPGAVK
ncbi:MAG TPA: hypothetical protein VGF55_04635 [Gemmataceae bacterium]|jgi:hypothetical protein